MRRRLSRRRRRAKHAFKAVRDALEDDLENLKAVSNSLVRFEAAY